jgi:hypothetical protein
MRSREYVGVWMLGACVLGCDDGNRREPATSPPVTIKLDLAPPPTQPISAEEQLRSAVGVGTIVNRSTCGRAHLLTIDPKLSNARTELAVATFDPDFVLGDRRQGRWSIHPIERLAEQDAAAWSGCIAIADRPTVFVATTQTTYKLLVHVTDHAGVVREGVRPPGVPVELSADERRGITLRVGSVSTALAWDQLQPR